MVVIVGLEFVLKVGSDWVWTDRDLDGIVVRNSDTQMSNKKKKDVEKLKTGLGVSVPVRTEHHNIRMIRRV